MEPGISSTGRPVSTPTDTFLSIDFLAELFFSKEFAQALTIDAATKPVDRYMSVGVLTGRPMEEMPGSMGDQLPELVQLLERVRQVMSGVVQALWPSVSLPEGLGGLVEKLQGAQRRLRLWKISACHQGAREAWAMVKTRYTKADPNHMAEVGPVGPDGKEIPVSLVYGQVELAAKYSK